MHQLTHNQELHRVYISSPLWAKIRQLALGHYGCICSRCGERGTDVHHKTYERWGGNEKLEDLEVLCRGCHEAHHRIERSNKVPAKKKKKKSARVEAVVRYLTKKQKQLLINNFGLYSEKELYENIVNPERDPAVRQSAMDLLGIHEAWWGRSRCKTKTSLRRFPIVHRNGKVISDPRSPKVIQRIR